MIEIIWLEDNWIRKWHNTDKKMGYIKVDAVLFEGS